MKHTEFKSVIEFFSYSSIDTEQEAKFHKRINDLVAKGWQVSNSGAFSEPKGLSVWVHLVKPE